MDCHKVILKEHFYGTATVGERGQIVVPADARKKYNISPGDKVLVLGHSGGGGLLILKIDSLREAFSYFLENLDRLEKEVKVNSEEDAG